MTTIDKVLISEDLFLSTFSDKKFYSPYHSAIAYSPFKDITIGEIAKRINKNYPTVYGWVTDTHRPECVKYVAEAKRLGFIPLTTNSPSFEGLSGLAGMVFWSGYVSARWNVMVSLRDNRRDQLRDYMKTLNLNYSLKPNGKTSRVSFESSNILGRILSLLGLPQGKQGGFGRKTEQVIHLPAYLKELSLEGSSYSNQVCKGFLAEAIHQRLQRGNGRHRMYLFARQTPNDAINFAKEYLDSFQKAFPIIMKNMEFDLETRNGLSYPVIIFRRDILIALNGEYPFYFKGLFLEKVLPRGHDISLSESLQQ